MDCLSYTVEAEVPPDLAEAATCSTAFYKVASALDQLEGEGRKMNTSSFYFVMLRVIIVA